ncbi:MAG: hypothetical protein ACLFM6_02790 [Spirochaetaceae bacterium]
MLTHDITQSRRGANHMTAARVKGMDPAALLRRLTDAVEAAREREDDDDSRGHPWR